jgi:hypothetical protein
MQDVVKLEFLCRLHYFGRRDAGLGFPESFFIFLLALLAYYGTICWGQGARRRDVWRRFRKMFSHNLATLNLTSSEALF